MENFRKMNQKIAANILTKSIKNIFEDISKTNEGKKL